MNTFSHTFAKFAMDRYLYLGFIIKKCVYSSYFFIQTRVSVCFSCVLRQIQNRTLTVDYSLTLRSWFIPAIFSSTESQNSNY